MQKKIIIAALGTMVAFGLSSSAIAEDKAMMEKTDKTLSKEMPGGFEKCYGISVAGKNDCASSTEACAGQAKTDGQKDAWLGVPRGTCKRIVGGSTTPGSNA